MVTNALEKAQLFANNTPLNKIEKGDDKQALKEQTDNFEAIILKHILDTAMPKEDPLFPKAAGNDIYNSMYRDELSKSLAGGFGFSQMLYDFLTREDIVEIS
jgi:Rod binding domain-containing protein